MLLDNLVRSLLGIHSTTYAAGLRGIQNWISNVFHFWCAPGFVWRLVHLNNMNAVAFFFSFWIMWTLLWFWFAPGFIWRQQLYLTMEVNHYWWWSNWSNCVFPCFLTHFPDEPDWYTASRENFYIISAKIKTPFLNLRIIFLTNRCRCGSMLSFGNTTKFSKSKVQKWGEQATVSIHFTIFSCIVVTKQQG